MKRSKKRKEELETRNQYLKEVVQSGDHNTLFRVIEEENMSELKAFNLPTDISYPLLICLNG
jgi:hypothetical protein